MVWNPLRNSWIRSMIRITCFFYQPDPSINFHHNALITFWVILLTDKQSDKQRDRQTNQCYRKRKLLGRGDKQVSSHQSRVRRVLDISRQVLCCVRNYNKPKPLTQIERNKSHPCNLQRIHNTFLWVIYCQIHSICICWFFIFNLNTNRSSWYPINMNLSTKTSPRNLKSCMLLCLVRAML